MADEQEKQEEQKSRGNKMLIIIIVAIIVIAIIVGVVLFFVLGGKKEKPKPQIQQAPQQAPQALPNNTTMLNSNPQIYGGPPKGPLVPFDTVIVNLNEPGGTRYLKTTFQIELSSKTLEKEVEKMKIPIKDALIEYLSSLTLSETQSADAKRKIKVNIINRINRFLTSGRVLNIYFTEFVVQ